MCCNYKMDSIKVKPLSTKAPVRGCLLKKFVSNRGVACSLRHKITANIKIKMAADKPRPLLRNSLLSTVAKL